MKGIAFINEKWIMNDFKTLDESLEVQKQSIQTFIENNQMKTIKLNPYQLHDYYTIPHALYYDLKQTKPKLDCLILYSEKVIESFIEAYPARWLILKSFFHKVIFLDEVQSHHYQDII
ncbi:MULTISPECIES: hypothetical protein [Cytobacillus]|uniref:hypothetical protein n=1 Tax=Cytobacillus TaxID=2675230 RepID=UPI001CD20949|nr:hypothetical protein [Cytobacillus kochii]MCA1028766.1 hypothetical protein [Cytobacillus kochii]MCM3322968.1 hypothetical protein [Cytobacillus kochii]MCM3345364.1 hypothetical protein [Cytobacillus kochii]MDM5208898.1 hypothetical protein [Cytobacillus kochii]